LKKTVEDTLYPLLKRNEVILWQGRPTRYFAPGVGAVVPVFFGLIFASGPAYGAYVAFQSGVFVMIAILFVIFGLSVASYALLNGMLIRRWSHYALTNYRAFVLIDHPLLGVDTTDWPINAKTELRNNGYNPMTITFAYAPRRFFGRHLRVIGFEHIDDGLNVFRVMMDVRDGLH
jgi:hypothetical protein